jgi:hypothetical protein
MTRKLSMTSPEKSKPKKSKLTLLAERIHVLREEVKKDLGFGGRTIERRLGEALEEVYLYEHAKRGKK